MLIVLELHSTGSPFSASSSNLLTDLLVSYDYLVVCSLLLTHYLVLKSMSSLLGLCHRCNLPVGISFGLSYLFMHKKIPEDIVA